MIVVYILVAVASAASFTAPKARAAVNKHRTFPFPRPLNVSDEALMIKDLSPFVRKHSRHEQPGRPRSANGTGAKPDLRIYARFYEDNYAYVIYNKEFDLMKHFVYGAQDRIRFLEPLLEKHKDDPNFRAGFIFTKMDHLIDEMRGLYSFAVQIHWWRRVIFNIGYFNHIAKKNIDITYMVEFMHEFHEYHRQKLTMVKQV